MNDIKKLVKSREESVLLIKVASKAIKKEAKEQQGRFRGIILGTVGASWLGNLLTG